MTLEVIQQKRREMGLTLTQLAEKIGASTSYLGYIEHGDKLGSDAMIKDIALALGLDYADIRRAQGVNHHPDEELIPKIKICTFVPGKTYKIRALGRFGTREKLRYLRKEGIHHVFQHPVAGWRTSYTDAQLVTAQVKACS